MDTAERFWSKVGIVESLYACWPWQSRTDDGYGSAWIDGRKEKSHRYAYRSVHGEIPVGLEIDHLCRNRACCNPWHLEAVTHRENVVRGDAPRKTGERAKARAASRTHCKNGHELTADNTYVLESSRHDGSTYRVCSTCAKDRANARYRSKLLERS